jgi:hypothetical protein
VAELHALARLALLADDLADALELARHAAIRGHDVVEGVGDLPSSPDQSRGGGPRSRRRAWRAARAAARQVGDSGAIREVVEPDPAVYRSRSELSCAISKVQVFAKGEVGVIRRSLEQDSGLY